MESEVTYGESQDAGGLEAAVHSRWGSMIGLHLHNNGHCLFDTNARRF